MTNKKSGFAAVAGIIIVLALLGLGGYFYSRTHQATPTIPITGPTTPAPTPEHPNGFTPPTTPPPSLAPATTDETANWKTYTDKEYGFEIKYPPDMHTQFIQADILFLPQSPRADSVKIQVVESGLRSPSPIPPSARKITSGNRTYYISGTLTLVDEMVSTFRFTK